MGKKSNEKKVKAKTVIEMPTSVPAPGVKLRKVILETDGNIVRVSANETSGNLELVSILNAVLSLIANGK